MFMSYCASCHGKSAKGDGPAAGALKQAAAELTTLAKQNGGKYPSDLVISLLCGQTKLMAHGDQEMPARGPVFWKMSQGHEEQVQMRIANLNQYIESLLERVNWAKRSTGFGQRCNCRVAERQSQPPIECVQQIPTRPTIERTHRRVLFCGSRSIQRRAIRNRVGYPRHASGVERRK